MKIEKWLNPNCSEVTMQLNGADISESNDAFIRDQIKKYGKKSKTISYDDAFPPLKPKMFHWIFGK